MEVTIHLWFTSDATMMCLACMCQSLSAVYMHVDSYNTNSSILFIQSKAWTPWPPLRMPIYGVKSAPTWYPMCQKCSHFNSSACGIVRRLRKPGHPNLCESSRTKVFLYNRPLSTGSWYQSDHCIMTTVSWQCSKVCSAHKVEFRLISGICCHMDTHFKIQDSKLFI